MKLGCLSVEWVREKLNVFTFTHNAELSAFSIRFKALNKYFSHIFDIIILIGPLCYTVYLISLVSIFFFSFHEHKVCVCMKNSTLTLLDVSMCEFPTSLNNKHKWNRKNDKRKIIIFFVVFIYFLKRLTQRSSTRLDSRVEQKDFSKKKETLCKTW